MFKKGRGLPWPIHPAQACEATGHKRKVRQGDMDVSAARRLKPPRDRNARDKRLPGDATPDNRGQAGLSGKDTGHRRSGGRSGIGWQATRKLPQKRPTTP